MTMFSQDQVNQWFAANPKATPEQVAQTVQGLGGLEANQGLAGLLGQHYGTDANTITNNYNNLTATAPSETGVLGLGPVNPATPAAMSAPQALPAAPTGLTSVAPAALPAQTTPVSAPPPPVDPLQAAVSKWATEHPTATPYQAANAITQNGGLTPAMAAAVAKQYNTTVDDVTSQYQTNSGINNLYKTYLGRDAESQDVVDYWAKNFGSTIDPDEIATFRTAAAPELKTSGYLSDPFKGEVKDYVSGVLADTTLTPWERTNKIMEQAQKSNVSQSQLESIYGKDAVNPYMSTYKQGINDFLTQTLAKDPGTTLKEVGAIHQAAQKYGLTPDEIAKYGGLDPKVAQSYFDMYDQGLGNLVTSLNDPKVTDVQKTATLLEAGQAYGTTDEEFAKASNGKYTAAEVKAYLDPVRNVPTNLQKLLNDPNASAADITTFINDAKKDPRAAGIYGTGLDTVLAAAPDLVMRDIQNGTGSLAQNYQTFLDTAKSTPELAAKYAPQIAAVEKRLGTATFSANENYGGKPQDYQLQIVSTLPAKKLEGIPQQLEMTPVKTETRYDPDYGDYQVQTGGGVKSKGVTPIGGEDTESGQNPITGYRATEPTTINGATVYATYDANGKLTGYEGDSRQRSWLDGKHSISGNWDANGNPKPAQYTSKGGGFLKGLATDVMGSFSDLGLVGQLALMYLTGGAASALGGAMGGGLLANAAAAGLVGGTMSEVGGGDFKKGFTQGAVTSGVGQAAQGAMPANFQPTGVPMVDSYLLKALPTAAGSMAGTAVNGGNVGDAGIYSLLNTGVNMGTNSLLQNSGIDTLDPKIQPYATGVASNLISSTLTGKDPNLENALMKTMMQQATSTGKQALKTANVP